MSKNELLAELLISKAQGIPDQVKKAFVSRSVEDARNLKLLIEAGGDIDLQKLSYAIYKAYTLGAALYDGDKLINEMDGIDEKEQEELISSNDKVVNISQFRKVSYS